MLLRLVESLLIHLFNNVRRGRGKSKTLPEETPEVPDDHIVLGDIISGDTEDHPGSAKKPRSARVATISPEARRRHLYVLGATGTGKTNLFLRLIESDIAHQRAFCVIDLRGDLVDRILPRLAETAPPAAWRERLLLIDLRHSEDIVGFNPLLGEGDVYNRALHILSVLKQQSESWGVQLEESLRNCLIALAEAGWSLLEIEPLLTNTGFRNEVLAQISDSHVKNFFTRYEQMSGSNQLAAASAVLNKVTPLIAIPQLRLLYGQRTSFSFRRLLDEQPGMIILISLAKDQLHDAGRLAGGLFVSAFETAIMSRIDQPESDRIPVHLYVDEFETMAAERFESIVAEGRRFGLGLGLSHQNLSQLSPALRNILRNIVHTQVYFQTGALDAAELAKEISCKESREEIRATIISQGVGEAYLVRRGQPSVRIRTARCPDPKVKPQEVAALRQASFATYARARAAVEQELKEREQVLASLDSKTAKTVKPTYEIRHGKTTSFKPKQKAAAIPDDEQPDAKPRGGTGVQPSVENQATATPDIEQPEKAKPKTRKAQPKTSKARKKGANGNKPNEPQ